jgi:ssDNA-binding Zn-finger/Zn-ribbon topoisomerase 1
MKLDDELWEDIRKKMILDGGFLDVVREAFYDTFKKAVGIKLTIDGALHKCPSCDRDMTIRINRKNGVHFWGCTGYPTCKCREDATEDDIELFKKRYPEKYKIIQEQQKLYEAGMTVTEEEKKIENGYYTVKELMEEVSVGRKKTTRRKKKTEEPSVEVVEE